jgi:muconate cycloisomerase
MHDESLMTVEDGRRLVDLRVADAFDIRMGKCGGVLPALQLAALARRSNVRVRLGAALGETSISSAVGIRFLQVCPGVEWAEGCCGGLVLRADVVRKGVRFRYGGRPARLSDDGLGITVDPERLAGVCDRRPVVLNL